MLPDKFNQNIVKIESLSQVPPCASPYFEPFNNMT